MAEGHTVKKSLRELEQELRDIKAAYDQLEDKLPVERDGLYYSPGYCGSLCMIGMAGRVLAPAHIFQREQFEDEFGLTVAQRTAIEAGFCDWTVRSGNNIKAAIEAHPALYQLGRRLARDWCRKGR